MRPSASFRFASTLALAVLVAAAVLRTTASAASAAEGSAKADPVTSGRATFQKFCAPCHGSDGRGNGAVASFLLKAPADVTQIRRRYDGVFPQADLEAALLATTRDTGRRVMATEEIVWGPVFFSMDSAPASARERVADLLAFLESVQEP